MRLAWAEIRRTRGRFAAMAAALALLVFLVLILSALADGLYYGATGALRSTRADLYTFSAGSRQQFARSSLPAAEAATIGSVPGVAEVGQVGTLQATGRCTGSCPGGLTDLALFGYVPGLPGGPDQAVEGRVPRPSEAGVAAADISLKEKGVRLGDRITVAGTTLALRIVGFTSDSRYELQPTLWTTMATWREVQAQARPELAGTGDTVQAFAERLKAGASPSVAAAAIDAALGARSATVDRQTAVLSLPGVREQRSTLDQIIYATLAVAGIVTALFFALITLEKRTQLALLKAIGASNRYLGASVAVQSAILCAAGTGLGVVVARLVALLVPNAVPLIFTAASTVTAAAGTFTLGTLGASFSFRRVARIDPATVLGGT
jgi:putative ABC transport system permease protein